MESPESAPSDTGSFHVKIEMGSPFILGAFHGENDKGPAESKPPNRVGQLSALKNSTPVRKKAGIYKLVTANAAVPFISNKLAALFISVSVSTSL
mgnify:CR=1 FL=1